MAMRLSLFPVLGLSIALAACGGGQDPRTPAAPAPEAAAPAAPPAAPEKSLAAVVAGDQRSAENKARDPYRHPVETLEFFGIRPDMTVVEIWPAGGWYTEILAPYLRDDGRFIAAHWNPEAKQEYQRKGVKAFQDKLAARPDLYDKVEMTVLAPPDKVDIAPPESADMVVTFRNIHNWMGSGQADAVFAAMYRALKPGGVLGVEEHR